MKKMMLLGTLLCSALFFSSCSKDNTEADAHLMIVNASPNGSNIDASVNGSVIVSGLAYPNNSGYKTVTGGTRNVTVSQSGSTSAFIDGAFDFQAGSYYSMYIVDSSSKRKARVLRDDLAAPAAGKAKIRLLHLSPNTPAVDVSFTGSSAGTFTNRSFDDIATNASYAQFTEVDAAGVSIQIKASGSSTILATIPGITLTAGKIYTFIIRGFTGATGTAALGIEVITHN